jgi:hypothetical protein
MKGGRTGAMLSPDRFIDDIRAFRQGKWRLTLSPPAEERMDEFRVLAKLYREIQEALEPAVEAEWSERRQWLADMEESFGADANRAAIVAALSEAREAAFRAGIASGNYSKPLADALERFQATQLDDALSAARAVAKLDDPMGALPHFGRGRRNAVDTARELRTVAAAFLDAVDQNLGAFSADQNAKHAASADSISRIGESLTNIERDLLAITPSTEGTADAA